jgi:cytochrome c556
MRIALFAATTAFVLLGACGGPQTSQANNTQANMTDSASTPATAGANAVQISTTPVDKATAGQLIKQREDAMKQFGKASKAIKRSLDATPADVAAVRQAAQPLSDTTAAKIVSLFPAGTGPDVAETGAKPDIWKNPQDFAQKAKNFEGSVKQFADAANAGNADNVKAAWGKVGNSCKACHDKYRVEDKH